MKLPLQHSHVVTVTLPLLHSHAITARSHHYVPLRSLLLLFIQLLNFHGGTVLPSHRCVRIPSLICCYVLPSSVFPFHCHVFCRYCSLPPLRSTETITYLTPALLHSQCYLRCIVLPSYLVLFHCYIRTTASLRCYVLPSSVMRFHCNDFLRQSEAPPARKMYSLTLHLLADTLSRFASTFSRPHCYAMHAGKVKIPLQQSPIGTCHTPTAVALIRWYILPSLLFHIHCYDHCRKVKLPLQHSHVVTVTLPLLHSHAITARSHHYVPLRLLRHCWNILTS